MLSDNYRQADDIIRDADIAMYRAKSLGKARYQVFDEAMRERAILQMTLERDLRLAVERNELQLRFQPIVLAKNRELIGFEALVRWLHLNMASSNPVNLSASLKRVT
ncbi:MAG: EAL domain-containing protein [Deinococcales bacterium]